MAQGFDSNKPAYQDPLLSEPMRTNLNALASCHSGTQAPVDPETGWLWLDTSDPTNYRLRMYIGGSWLIILNNLAGGYPSQSTVGQYVHTQAVAAATWSIVHNLNSEDVTIQFWDSSDQLMFPDTITVVSPNIVQATFLVVTAGKSVVLG